MYVNVQVYLMRCLYLYFMATSVIDLNCDLGEGMQNDAAIMPFISSANIACGFHAGDDETMQQTIRLCMQHHVAIGAHPSFHDKVNFGRTEINLPPETIIDLVTAQLQILQQHCLQLGAAMHHIKPHGALYNMSAKNDLIAAAIAKAVFLFNPKLVLFGLAGSCSLVAGKQAGLQVVHEFFADRSYQPDASLTPRSQQHALITDTSQALQQALLIAEKKMVPTVEGDFIQPCNTTDTVSICLHGDGPHAVDFAKAIHAMFLSKNIRIQPAL